MAYPLPVKEKAIKLRKKGYSIKEVAKKMKIAKSTSSLWLRNVVLNKKAEQRLEKRRIYGQYKAHQTQKLKRIQKRMMYEKRALDLLRHNHFSNCTNKLLCALLYWAEGAKDNSHVHFVNSDPKMITTFLELLRCSFAIQEEKFRACLHVHEYHNEPELKKAWSKFTKIPISQFNKSYKKPHTKKRKRPGYMGCLALRYYDRKIALELSSLYNMYSSKIIGV